MDKRPIILPAEPQQVATLTIKTQVSGNAVRKRIAVVDRVSQKLLWYSFTNDDGEITRILPLQYASTDFLCVKAYDDTETYNAVIADFVQAELVAP